MACKVRAWAHLIAVDVLPLDSTTSNLMVSTPLKKEVLEELCWNGVQFRTRKAFLAKLAGLIRHGQIPTDWRYVQSVGMALRPEAMALKMIEERYHRLKLRYLKSMWEQEHARKRVADSVANMTDSKLEHHIGLLAQKFGRPLDDLLWQQVQANTKEQRRLQRSGDKRVSSSSRREHTCRKGLRIAWAESKALAFEAFDWHENASTARKALAEAEEFLILEHEREKSLERDRQMDHKGQLRSGNVPKEGIPRKCMVIEDENYRYPGRVRGDAPTNNPTVVSKQEKRLRFAEQRVLEHGEDADSGYTAKIKQRVRLCEARERAATKAMDESLRKLQLEAGKDAVEALRRRGAGDAQVAAAAGGWGGCAGEMVFSRLTRRAFAADGTEFNATLGRSYGGGAEWLHKTKHVLWALALKELAQEQEHAFEEVWRRKLKEDGGGALRVQAAVWRVESAIARRSSHSKSRSSSNSSSSSGGGGGASVFGGARPQAQVAWASSSSSHASHASAPASDHPPRHSPRPCPTSHALSRRPIWAEDVVQMPSDTFELFQRVEATATQAFFPLLRRFALEVSPRYSAWARIPNSLKESYASYCRRLDLKEEESDSLEGSAEDREDIEEEELTAVVESDKKDANLIEQAGADVNNKAGGRQTSCGSSSGSTSWNSKRSTRSSSLYATPFDFQTYDSFSASFQSRGVVPHTCQLKPLFRACQKVGRDQGIRSKARGKSGLRGRWADQVDLAQGELVLESLDAVAYAVDLICHKTPEVQVVGIANWLDPDVTEVGKDLLGYRLLRLWLKCSSSSASSIGSGTIVCEVNLHLECLHRARSEQNRRAGAEMAQHGLKSVWYDAGFGQL